MKFMQEMNLKLNILSQIKEEEILKGMELLSIDVQIKRISDDKLVIVSHRNLYRIKK